MQTYEFFAKPENGFIPIPEQYKSLITDDVMVIVIAKLPFSYNRKVDEIRKKTDLLPPPVLKTSGFNCSREEANER